MAALTMQRQAAMAAGRERHLKAQRAQNRRDWIAFRKWLHKDAELHRRLEAAREAGTRAEVERARSAASAHLRTLRLPNGPKPADL